MGVVGPDDLCKGANDWRFNRWLSERSVINNYKYQFKDHIKYYLKLVGRLALTSEISRLDSELLTGFYRKFDN